MTSHNRESSWQAEMDKWAETIRWFGIGSLLPYLLFGTWFYAEKSLDQLFFPQVENGLAALCVFWGIIFGSVTLISGIAAVRQIYGSKNTKKRIRSVVFGIVCGLLAIVSNLVTVFIVFASD